MSTSSSSSSSGIGIGALLGVLFIGLKLGKVIDWSWLWVLSPFWIPIGIVLAVALAFLAFAVINAAFKSLTH
jgi:uncharacterized membrane protein YdbT with pleckstrin-like domain